jgi:hypothetical protein
MFRIEMMPAQRGDALWITYGTQADLHHILIDAGPQETIPTLVPELEARIKALPGKTNRVELFVVTHIDADHIQGAVSLLSDDTRVSLFRDIWFNGWGHHQPDVLGEPDAKLLGGPDAERVTRPLLAHTSRWNRAFRAAAVAVTAEGALPTKRLRGGMEITVLAPDKTAMLKLVPQWEKACKKAGIDAGGGAPIIRKKWIRDEVLGVGFDPDLLAASRFSADGAAPNGAGIALIAAYGGKRVLLLADCPPKPIIAALDRLGAGPHRFDAVKVAHHGSRRNTNRELCQRIVSRKWLISTNGAQFDHPDPECLARIVVSQNKPTFYLNYVTDRVADFIEEAGQRYTVKLPRRKADGSYGQGIALAV